MSALAFDGAEALAGDRIKMKAVLSPLPQFSPTKAKRFWSNPGGHLANKDA